MPPAGTKIDVAKEFTNFVREQDKDDDDPETDAEWAVLVAKPEMQFFLCVWLPCYIEYRVYSSRLFASARRDKGQIRGPEQLRIADALDKLLRIDKSVLFEPRIAKHWHESARARHKGRFKKLAKAVAGRPAGSMTIEKTKRALAALVVELAKLCLVKITEPEVRELFDLVAQIQKKELRDKDI